VIALVSNNFLETVPVGQDRLNLFGGLNQRLSTGRRIGVLHGHAHAVNVWNVPSRSAMRALLTLVRALPSLVGCHWSAVRLVSRLADAPIAMGDVSLAVGRKLAFATGC
jgi:hypothetical protein